MIKTLRARNYLFIKDQLIVFSPGMNVFIGESGVGKSLIANILLIPEKKVKSDIVGKWDKEAIIDIEIEVKKNIYNIQFIISEKLSFYINGENVTQKKMKEFWQEVVDLHSQGNYQLLYNSQLEIIDSFMTESENQVKQKYVDSYLVYDKKREEIKELKSKIITESEKDLYLYHQSEIHKVSPKIKEDDELFVMLKQIKNKIDLETSISKIQQGLEDAGAGLKVAVLEADKLFNLRLISKELADGLNELFVLQEDFLWQVTKTTEMDRIEDIDSIEHRLSELENLKVRFKKSLEEIITYSEEIKDKLDNRDYYEARLKKKEVELREDELKLEPLAESLSNTRKKVLERVILRIRESLKVLKLDKTELSYRLKTKDNFSLTGNDELEILIKVNVGASFVGLQELSGGETSRVLLAFKSALQDVSDITTYVFDEIDSGVSGDISFKVMDVMRNMATDKQLIVVSHSPMIAVNTDVLFKIQKTFKDNETQINVTKHQGQEEIFSEVAMLVTDKSSDEAKAYVRSLVRKR